jgi:PKD repeat protein
MGEAFTRTPALEDALDRPATSWSVTGLPAGLTLNTSTGAITGTPAAIGSFAASFTATGGGGASEATNIAFTIAAGPPIITAGQTASGAVGTAFSKTFSLTDSTNRPVTSWAATGLPSWAALNTTTGAITGTPQDSGSATITLTATGPEGSDTETAVISIAVGPPSIVAGQSFTGKVGEAFTQTPTLEDALDRPATSWSVTGLPAGLTLNTSTGAITGTPTAKGSFTASFTATGGGGTSAAASIAFTIAEGVPLIVSGQGFSVFLNSYFKRDVALENEANRSVTGWSVSGAAWAQISAAGEISGVPMDSGDYVLVVTATGPGGTDTEAISVLVRAGGLVVFRKPIFSGAPEMVNDLIIRGDEFLFARWTGKGGIPTGMNWVGMEEGLRFWGTPTRVGQWEAEFEGPYPPNFHSDLTIGGSDRPPLQLDAGEMPEEIVVSRFTLQFQVVEQEGYSFGQVLKELLSNPSMTQTARRLAWSGTRCIGARGFSELVAESGVTSPVKLGVAQGLNTITANLAEKINSSGIAKAYAAGSKITITALEVGVLQITAASTKSGAISVASVSQGSTTAKQVSAVTISGAFQGGVVYSVGLGEDLYTVTTQADLKVGLWRYDSAEAAGSVESAVGVRGLRNDDLDENDLSAGDWVFSESPVIGRDYDGCLETRVGPGQGLIDGVKRSVAVNAVIAI